MARRGWGAIILAVAVMISIILPAASGLGRRTHGQAVRTPVPSPPTVGAVPASVVDPDGSALKPFSVSIASASAGACADDAGSGQPSHGEIVSVVADQPTFAPSAAGQVSVPEPTTCQPAAERYVGWPGGRWAPVATRAPILVGPDISQYLSGQRWIACAIRPGETEYFGSIRGGHRGPAADAFGRCELSGAAPHVRGQRGRRTVDPRQSAEPRIRATAVVMTRGGWPDGSAAPLGPPRDDARGFV